MNWRKPKRRFKYWSVNEYMIINKIYSIISELYELQGMLLDYLSEKPMWKPPKKPYYKPIGKRVYASPIGKSEPASPRVGEANEPETEGGLKVPTEEEKEKLFEELLAKVEQKTAFPKEVLMEKVNKKIKEYHGLITKIGALKLVLKDLGKEEIADELFNFG